MDAAVAAALPQLHRGATGQVICGDALTDRETKIVQGANQDRASANIRLALILGAIALGFFVLGLYLASGEQG